jgi:CarD family transcriptional regulator
VTKLVPKKAPSKPAPAQASAKPATPTVPPTPPTPLRPQISPSAPPPSIQPRISTVVARPTEPPPAPVIPAAPRPPRTSPFAIKAPPPSGAPLKLSVGDKAVHPQHGLGQVISIEEREIGGTKSSFYVLRILDKKEMRVMVPVGSPSGLRNVMSRTEAEAVLETMRAREVAVDLQPWSRRFRAYTEMIKSGLPHEVAKVLRDMYRLKFDKDLSFGERRLLDQAKSLLMKELAVAKGITEEQLLAEVAQMFQS